MMGPMLVAGVDAIRAAAAAVRSVRAGPISLGPSILQS